MRHIFILLCALISSFQVHAQLNTFNRQLLHVPDLSARDYNALCQTNDRGYVVCRSTVDTLAAPNRHYSEIIKIDKTGKASWVRQFYRGYTAAGDTLRVSATCVGKVSDGNYLLGTSELDHLKRPQICLIKLSATGNVLWSKKYLTQGYGSLNCIRETSDQGFVACGYTKDTVSGISYALAFKVNHSGQFVWGLKSVISNHLQAQFNTIAEIPGAGYVFGGFSGNAAILLKTGTSGNVIWSKSYFNSGGNFVNAVIYTSDNKLLFTGQCNLPTSSYGALYIAKSDTAGNIVWINRMNPVSGPPYFGSYGADLKEKNNAYYITGYLQNPIPSQFIAKIGFSGSLMWCNNYSNSFHPFNYTPATLDTCIDGGLVFTTLGGTVPGIYSSALIKTDVLGKAGCDANNYNMQFAAISTAAGIAPGSSACGAETPLVVSLNSINIADSVVCSAITDSLFSIPEPENACAFLQNYPNPCFGNTTIKFSFRQPVNVVWLEIYDVLGLSVFQKVLYNVKAGPDSIGLPDLNLKAGMYFYSLIYNGAKQTKMMMVLER